MIQSLYRKGGLTLAIALSLGGCASAPVSTPVSDPSPSESLNPQHELTIVTTFLPMTQFTRAVVGDRAEVVQLMPINVGPHDYQAKPTDVQAIATADILVKNGLGLEGLDDLVANANNSDLMMIDSSKNIALLPFDPHDQGVEADHDHGHGKSDPHDQDVEADGDDDHDHDHGEYDPHIWLDPQRAIEQVQTIRDGIIVADPTGAAEYRANAADYIQRLQELDQTITKRLAPYAGQTFITFHDFARYFGDRYDLNPQYLVDVPLERLSPEDMRRMITTVQAANIKVLLTEPQAGAKTFDTLANDLNIAVSIFDPIATADPNDPAALSPDYYLTVMGQNLDRLVAAFDGATQ